MSDPVASVSIVIARIRAYAKANDLSIRGLAMAAGLPPSTLRDFWDPAWNPTAETLRKLEAVVPGDFQAPEIHGRHPAVARGGRPGQSAGNIRQS